MPTQVAQLPRKVQTVFGSALSAPGNVALIGTLKATPSAPVYSSDVAVLQSLAEFAQGLQGVVVGDRSISLEEMMGVLFMITSNLAYTLQSGVPEWNADTTYYVGNIVRGADGTLYKSLTGGNLNNAITDTNNWTTSVSCFPAKAKMGSGQLINVDGNGHKLAFNTKLYDPANAYSNANAQYTAPVAGIYNLCVYTQVDNSGADQATTELSLRVVVNGVVTDSFGESVSNPPGQRWYPKGAIDVPLNAGDVVEIQLEATDSGNTGQLLVSNAGWSIAKRC
jgi:hypothetical protein